MSSNGLCRTCTHWRCDDDSPWGECERTWTDAEPPDGLSEAKYPDSPARVEIMNWGLPVPHVRALLSTNGAVFGCNQWAQADERAMRWLAAKLGALARDDAS